MGKGGVRGRRGGGGGEISGSSARRRRDTSFERDIQRIQPHQYLALCRAETAGVVRVSVEWDDTPAVDAARRAW